MTHTLLPLLLYLSGSRISAPAVQEDRSIEVVPFLLSTCFEGVQLDGPTSKSDALDRPYSKLKSTGKTIRLRFRRRTSGHGNPGFHRLLIGSDVYEGEFSVSEDFVHLWIDSHNGKSMKPGKESMAVFFRVPHIVDEPFVIRDFQVPSIGQRVRGVLLVKAVPGKPWRTVEGRVLKAGKTVVKPAGGRDRT